eukprot:1090561-Prymnesium_polylepis.4
MERRRKLRARVRVRRSAQLGRRRREHVRGADGGRVPRGPAARARRAPPRPARRLRRPPAPESRLLGRRRASRGVVVDCAERRRA